MIHMIAIQLNNKQLTMDEVNSMMDWLSQHSGGFTVLSVGTTQVMFKSEDDLLAFKLKYGV